MNQENTGTTNPIANEDISTPNKIPKESINETAVEPITSTTPTPTSSTTPSTGSKKSKALIATTIICAILAIASLAFGVYASLESNQKSSQISDLKNEVAASEAKISELETDLSTLASETNTSEEVTDLTDSTEVPRLPDSNTQSTGEASSSNSNNGTAIDLITEITETDTTKVYKIGECIADSGTGAAPHFSLKCQVTVSGKDALITYHDGDNNILRLSLPKN